MIVETFDSIEDKGSIWFLVIEETGSYHVLYQAEASADTVQPPKRLDQPGYSFQRLGQWRC